MCRLAGVSRAGFYRFLAQRQPQEEDMEVRAAIQSIALEHRRRYGYRRVTAELRRRGMGVNHKRVVRLMREDNLLAMQPKAFVATTESDHELEVYLNLAHRLKLTGINQLWVADITYIRLRGEFAYLAVVLDAFSRKVVGWELSSAMTARLAVTALERAIAARKPGPRPGPSLRSRRAICFGGIYRHAAQPRHVAQHEPSGQPLRQRRLRELHEDLETGGDLRPHVSRHRRSARPHRGVHRSVLQSSAASLRPRLPHPGGVRSLGPARSIGRGQREFFQAWGNLSMG